MHESALVSSKELFSQFFKKKNTTGHASATHFDHLQLLLA